MRARASGVGKRLLAIVVGATIATTATAPPAAAEDPLFIPWTSLLPGFTVGYEPSSENDCKAGRIQCVDAVIREMERRWEPLDDDCDHNAVFALTYLRTTEEYRRSATQDGFFSDPGFINHQDAVFAQYYFEEWDTYRAGDVAGTSRAWHIAFEAADRRQVNGTGDMLLGMSAHVNRDLPFVLAAIGLVKPDGSSRKPDHDKVNEFLNRVIEPLITEVAQRYDPTVDDAQIKGTTLDETLLLQLLVGWRELAWRNAEALVAAPTPEARAQVAAHIERQAAIEANLIKVATAYSSVNVQAALDELTALLADPAAVLQAELDRTANHLRGLLGSLFVDAAAKRATYCAATH